MYTAMGTRADEYEHSRIVSQLATISVAGGDADRRLFPQNLSHSVAPFLRHDGTMGYSRWEHFGGTNDVKLFAASPGGSNMVAVGGQHGKPVNSLINVKEVSPNVMVGIGTDRDRTIHSGTLIQIDSRNQADAFCLDANNAPFAGHQCLDEEHSQFTVLTPDVPVTSDPSPVGRYREPSVAARMAASSTAWADGPVNDLNELSATPPDYGIYVYDPVAHTNQLIFNDRNDLGPERGRGRRPRRAPGSSATSSTRSTRRPPCSSARSTWRRPACRRPSRAPSSRTPSRSARRCRAPSPSESSRASRARPRRASRCSV